MWHGPTRSMISANTGSDFFRCSVATLWLALYIRALCMVGGKCNTQANEWRIKARSSLWKSRGKMEVHIVPGGNWCAVERGWLIVPAAKRGLDLFVDAVADRLHNLRLDDVPLGIDRHLNDDIAYQVPRKLGAVHGRIGIHDRIRDMALMAGDRPVNHGAQRRSGVGVVVARFRVGDYLLRRGHGLWLGLRKWAGTRLARRQREQQRSHVWRSIVRAGRVNQLIGVSAISKG